MSNVISFVGRLGRDTERKQAGQSTVLEFSVGENVGYGDNKHTNWWKCSIWGKQAESSLIDYLKKGAQVMIHGEVKLREYQEKIYPEIRVINIEIVGGKSEPKQETQQQGYAKQQQQQRKPDLDGDDLPF